MTTATTTIELVQDFYNNRSLTINEVNEIRNEETHQTIGRVMTDTGEVIEHLGYLGHEDVDPRELNSLPDHRFPGLNQLDETTWLQTY